MEPGKIFITWTVYVEAELCLCLGVGLLLFPDASSKNVLKAPVSLHEFS